MPLRTQILGQHLLMLPREIFDFKAPDKNGKVTRIDKQIPLLREAGVYILYRDDIPYYIGQAKSLGGRLYGHARRPTSRRYHFWNYVSVFTVAEREKRSEIEALLIAAFPTANGAKPTMEEHRLDRDILKFLHAIRPVRVISHSRLKQSEEEAEEE